MSFEKVPEEVPELNNSNIVIVSKKCLLTVTNIAEEVPEVNDKNSVIVAVSKKTRCQSRNPMRIFLKGIL